MRFTSLLLTLLVAFALIPASPIAANSESGKAKWFSETGHTLAFAFREFYEAHSGLQLFGYPLTEVFREDGRPVQYFERARLEWHATLGLVQIGHLGRWAGNGLKKEAAFQPIGSPDSPGADRDYHNATRHTVGGAFRTFWHTHGGLPIFGFPISEEWTERNAEDGREYTVQYFERARFEFHPDLPPEYQVSLGHLGRRYLARHPAPEWAAAPVANADGAWGAFRPTRVVAPRIGIDTEVVEAGFSLDAWDVPRFTAAHYWPVSAFPGTAGNVVIAGHVGYRDTIFSHLPEIRVGDEIVVHVGKTPHRYVVTEILTLLPHESWVMLPTADETLTLITCVPIGVYSHRLVVRALPVKE